MADNPTVSNSAAASNPDIPVRSTETAGGKQLQHVRLDYGNGSTESQVTAANPLPVTVLAAVTGQEVNLKSVGGTNVTLGQKAMTASFPVVLASDNSAVPISGDIAHDAGDSGNPQKIGFQARQTNPAAVSDADRVNGVADDIGRQVVVLSQVRDLVTDNNITITSSTSETTLLSAVASTFLDLTQLIITNSSSTATSISIRDATAGTVRMIIDIAANGGAVISLPVPRPQTAVNNNWTAQCSTGVASIHIYAQAVKNV